MINYSQGSESGIDVAEYLLDIIPNINVIIYNGDSPSIEHVTNICISDYIQIPLSPKKVIESFSHLRYRISEQRPVLRAQTFGCFELFYGDVPVKFKYNKSKELIAYLIDRQGAMCSRNDLMAVLWEDDDTSDHSEYFKKIRKDVTTVLNSIGYGHILISWRGMIGINTSEIDCDLYHYLSHHRYSYAYRGEYMIQYSWAEITHAAIL